MVPLCAADSSECKCVPLLKPYKDGSTKATSKFYPGVNITMGNYRHVIYNINVYICVYIYIYAHTYIWPCNLPLQVHTDPISEMKLIYNRGNVDY